MTDLERALALDDELFGKFRELNLQFQLQVQRDRDALRVARVILSNPGSDHSKQLMIQRVIFTSDGVTILVRD